MNPTTKGTRLILTALFLSGGVLSAQSNSDPKPTSSSHPGTLSPVPASVTVADSPLVRAAKASRRTGIKPSTVITNDTLVRRGGHFTTTSSPQPVLPHISGPKPQTDEEWLAEARKKNVEAAAAVAAERKTEIEKKLAAAGRAQLMEGDTAETILNDPPPADGPIQPMRPTTPSSMETTKPPL